MGPIATFANTARAADPILPAPPVSTPFPAGLGLTPDRDLRVLAGARALSGGSPLSLVRMRPRAAAMVRGWLGGEPVADRRPDRAVARRLVSRGILHPRPPEPAYPAPLTVVVPVRDRREQLSRLLASLGDVPCIVVDDCSSNPAEIEKVVRDAGAEYLRLDEHSGPAAARNAGLAKTNSPLVAFIDSDCTVPAGWLDPLRAHFGDPRVGLVAPRVVAAGGQSWLARFDASRSPLDLGPTEGRIAPRTRLSYVPAAAIVVRRAAVGARCFDERLGAGEDVDLVWRLVDAGWEARYVPGVEVRHETDLRPVRWLSRRALYGSTAGPLAIAHGDAIAPARLSPSVTAVWFLLGGRRPVAAAAVAVGSTALLASRLAGVVDDPVAEAARLSLLGMATAVPPTVVGLSRAWGPALAIALGVRRLGRLRPIAAAVLVGTAARGWRRAGGLDPLRHVAAGLLDDLAYGSGVWWGCWRARTLVPLLPVVARKNRRDHAPAPVTRSRISPLS